MLDEYRYIQHFRVPFADIDMLQHVNNTAYVRWAEQIRSAYFAEILEEHIGGERGIIIAKLEVVYERPVFYRDLVAIGCRVSRIGRKSFDLTYEIWNEGERTRCAHLHTSMVAFNYPANESIVVPEEWRRRVAAFETAAAPVA